MRLKTYLKEGISDKEVLEKAKEILKQKSDDEIAFKKSMKNIDISKLSKRIKFRKYSPDENVKALILSAVDIFEDILKIPKGKYQVVLTKGETVGGGSGQVWQQIDKNIIHLTQDVYSGKSIKNYEIMLKTLAHEMIHIEQHYKKPKSWFNYDLSWSKRPQEIDAHKREDGVYNKFLTKAVNIFLGSDIKIENGKLYKLSRSKPTGFDITKHFEMLSKEVPNLSFGDLDGLEHELEWKRL